MSQNYRSIAQKDALGFAQFLCAQEVRLGYDYFLIFIENDGSIKGDDFRGMWPEGVEFPNDLLQHLRKAGLTGSVLLSAAPEEAGNTFGIEIQVDNSNFYPALPNPIVSSYSPTGYVGADGKLVRIPRDPHPGRYYFPNVITVS